jgi:hypothetical protein
VETIEGNCSTLPAKLPKPETARKLAPAGGSAMKRTGA